MYVVFDNKLSWFVSELLAGDMYYTFLDPINLPHLPMKNNSNSLLSTISTHTTKVLHLNSSARQTQMMM